MTGQLPFQETTREGEPQKPSTKVSHLGPDSELVAQERRTSGSALVRELRGDLDWIIMKALEHDRDRRYATPIGLAEDIERHLHDEPVEAGPPSTAYRVRKFVRRYRLQVAAACAVLVTLLLGMAGTTFFMFEAEAKAHEASTNLDNFNLLANVVKLKEAKTVYDDPEALYPAWPEKADAMRRWVEQYAEPLEQKLPELQRTLEAVRLRAQEPTDEDRERWLQAHPRSAELTRLRRKSEALSNVHCGAVTVCDVAPA